MSQRKLHISGLDGWDGWSPGGVKYRAAYKKLERANCSESHPANMESAEMGNPILQNNKSSLISPTQAYIKFLGATFWG